MNGRVFNDQTRLPSRWQAPCRSEAATHGRPLMASDGGPHRETQEQWWNT
jgi:hypothetical protein